MCAFVAFANRPLVVHVEQPTCKMSHVKRLNGTFRHSIVLKSRHTTPVTKWSHETSKNETRDADPPTTLTLTLTLTLILTLTLTLTLILVLTLSQDLVETHGPTNTIHLTPELICFLQPSCARVFSLNSFISLPCVGSPLARTSMGGPDPYLGISSTPPMTQNDFNSTQNSIPNEHGGSTTVKETQIFFCGKERMKPRRRDTSLLISMDSQGLSPSDGKSLPTSTANTPALMGKVGKAPITGAALFGVGPGQTVGRGESIKHK